jgi:hypothetical protein
MGSIKQDLFGRAISQIISSKMLRNVAIKQLNNELHKMIFNDPSVTFLEVKEGRYNFL